MNHVLTIESVAAHDRLAECFGDLWWRLSEADRVTLTHGCARVLRDGHLLLFWAGNKAIIRWRPAWNHDHDLDSGEKNGG